MNRKGYKEFMKNLDYCVMCDPSKENKVVKKGLTMYVMYNKFPYIEGTTQYMVCPVKHKGSLFELNIIELIELFILTKQTVKQIRKEDKKARLQIYFNDGGDSVLGHLHVHILKYDDDNRLSFISKGKIVK